MPMIVKWDDANEGIILITTTPPITWEIFDAGVDEALELASSVSYRVDVITNPGATQMPPGSPLPHLQRAYGNLPDNVGMIVSLVSNFFARNITSMVARFYLGSRFQVADSLETAYRLIAQSRESGADT